MEIKKVSIDTITAYEFNAKEHPKEQIEQIKKSIMDFGNCDPIAVDEDGVIIEGHGRYIALAELGYKEVEIIRLEHLTEEQKKAYRLVHNKLTMNSDFDFEILERELAALNDINMEDFGFDFSEFENSLEEPTLADELEEVRPSLQDRYIIPPFSVFDTKQGYWQERKNKWLQITGNLSETRDGDFGKISNGGNSLFSEINNGTSNFDPVLAEIIYKWFCVDDGKILDPFGGEQTKGVVAGELGYKYEAVEFRQEQVELNKSKTKAYKDIKYYCGDSNDISKIIKGTDFDLCFTSPPYYDLEVYSKEDMSALGSYEEFMEQYENIFSQCVSMLANDSFLVVKVGEIRNKKSGEYRCFVADNIKMFQRLGLNFYNDIVLLNAVGTAAVRANNCMKTRKVVKLHQNVLVFYKGDTKNIANKYKNIEFELDNMVGE